MKRKIITTISTIIYILILEEPSINKRISVISNIAPPTQLYNVPNILLNSTNTNDSLVINSINNNSNNDQYSNYKNNQNYHHNRHNRHNRANKYDRQNHRQSHNHKHSHNKHHNQQHYHENVERNHHRPHNKNFRHHHHQRHRYQHYKELQQFNQHHPIKISKKNQIDSNSFIISSNNNDNDSGGKGVKRNGGNSKRSIRHINSYNDEVRIDNIENQYDMEDFYNEKFYNNNNDINNHNNYYDKNDNIEINIENNDDKSKNNIKENDIINNSNENNYNLEHDNKNYLQNQEQQQQHHQQQHNQQHINTKDNINSLINCPKCSSSSENIQKVHVSQEQLNKLRIDFVKRQILEKLRLKDPPQVSAVDYIPQPITEMEYNTVNSKEDLDDYYARTSKKFIILEREYKECAFINKDPAICFSFKIDDVDTDNMDVNQAVLWVYVKPNNNEQMKQTIVVSECEQQMNSKYLPKIKPIAIKSVDVTEGWIKIDIAWPIKKWVGTHELSHLIQITCNSCELESETDGFIALEKQFQPFIVIDTQYRRQRSRQKRSVNCSAGVKECCREKLYISFKEIGWGDWIISPTGYNAYFCRGSCNSIASIASSNNHHSLIIKTLKDKFDRPLELIPCCTAKQFSQLELLFRDSNNTITQKFLPNMIVESCGCM